jgi:GH24 family phage-related lysozyme (muramidase)
MTPQGYSKLIEFEGEQFSAYPDSLGFWTIGIGHCIDERKGCGISQNISRRIFEDDLARFTATARANFEWFDALDPVRQDVIVMLLFNLGASGLHTFHLLLKAYGEHAWHEAAFQLANSLWGRQVGAERKREMCNAIEQGKW